MREPSSTRPKRSAAAIVITCLLMIAAPAHAAPSDREVTKPYSMPNGMVVGTLQVYSTLTTEYLVFKARAGERSVTFSIADATGADVRGHVHLDFDGDGQMDDGEDFCSESDPIQVRPGQRVMVGVMLGHCRGGEPSLVTQGTVTATFSK